MKCKFVQNGAQNGASCKCAVCNKVIDCEDCSRLDMDCVSQGLGDTIARITSALNIPKCVACEERQKQMNKMFPYGNGTP